MDLIQFGDGKFLRGFLPSMLDQLTGSPASKVYVIAPLRRRTSYTQSPRPQPYTLRILDGKTSFFGDDSNTENTPVHRSAYRYVDPGSYQLQPYAQVVNPYLAYPAFLMLGLDPDLRYIVSNTTEQGFRIQTEERNISLPDLLQDCPNSFPLKLTALLIHRFLHADDHVRDQFIEILPTELLPQNGDQLRDCVRKVCKAVQIPNLVEWIETNLVFRNTLVDRIVIEDPQGEKKEKNIVSEPYFLWVIEDDACETSDGQLCGLIRARSIHGWYERKIHILNAGHLVLLGMHRAYSFDTIYAAMQDSRCKEAFVAIMEQEVLPYVDAPNAREYLALCIARFSQNGLQHRCSAIAVNLFEKLVVRILPIIRRYWDRHQQLPPKLCQTVLRCAEIQCETEYSEQDQMEAKQGGIIAKLEQLFGKDKMLFAAFKKQYF